MPSLTKKKDTPELMTATHFHLIIVANLCSREWVSLRIDLAPNNGVNTANFPRQIDQEISSLGVDVRKNALLDQIFELYISLQVF